VRGVPHLKELNEKFRSRGFEIVAVSDEDEHKIDSFVKEHSIEYGTIRAQGVLDLYGGRGYPSAWALDTEGKVVWSGHPANVTGDMVEKWVENVAPTKVNKELNRALKGAVKAFDSGELGKALTEAKELGDKTDDLAAKADADYLESLVQKHIDLNTAKRSKAKESGDLVALGVALEEAATKFKGHEIGEKADTELKELKKSKEFKDTLDAHKELEKIKPYLKDYRPSTARTKLEKIADKYPETPAGKEAAELAKQFVD
jgi:hypothetical protein